MVLQGVQGFRDDYMSHVEHGRCLFGWTIRCPACACPAGVDIPGYIALVRAGRYNDAVRLIRKITLPHGLRLCLRASVRGALPPQHGGRRGEHLRHQALCVRSRDRYERPRPVRRPPESALPLSAAVRAVCLRLIFCR